MNARKFDFSKSIVTLVLTYQCNFRCTYCQIDKRDFEMTEEIFSQTIYFLKQFSTNNSIEKLKFFGGEPLLRKDYIRRTTESLGSIIPSFTLTTNGVLLESDFCNYAQDNSVYIVLSLDGDDLTNKQHRISVTKDPRMGVTHLRDLTASLSQVSVNQVITNKTVKNMYQNFLYLIEKGFTEFNFLPEYYVEWDKNGLIALSEQFSKILEYCKTHKNISVQYSDVDMSMGFFNFWIIIDSDGRIYATDLILWDRLEKYKDMLSIGDVWKGITVDVYAEGWMESYLSKIHEYLSLEYSKKTMVSVKYIDSIIRSFFKTYFLYKNAN